MKFSEKNYFYIFFGNYFIKAAKEVKITKLSSCYSNHILWAQKDCTLFLFISLEREREETFTLKITLHIHFFSALALAMKETQEVYKLFFTQDLKLASRHIYTSEYLSRSNTWTNCVQIEQKKSVIYLWLRNTTRV